MKYLKYLKYMLRHKWYVFVECYKLGIIWQGIVHDLSKFLPSEFFPYVNYFYGDGPGPKRESSGYYTPYKSGDEAFEFGWLLHQKRNAHHWQYWILIRDNDDDEGAIKVFDIPLRYRKELLADWRGAGKAQNFGDNTEEWYTQNRHKMIFHSNTRKWLEEQIFGTVEKQKFIMNKEYFLSRNLS